MKKRILPVLLLAAAIGMSGCGNKSVQPETAVETQAEVIETAAETTETAAETTEAVTEAAASESVTETAASSETQEGVIQLPEKETSVGAPEAESAEPAPSEETTETETEPAAKHIVAVDAGHQGPGLDMSGTEPNGPGSDVMKARMVTGTSGAVSGLAEYELNLQISLQLKEELLSRGYEVVMTRETHDAPLSNIDRCEIANEAGAEIFVRIHANGSDDTTVNGALACAPSESNPYIGDMYQECTRLSQIIVDSYCEATGLGNRGLWITDDMTGMNWAKMPVTILEMGFMTNAEDDSYMADPENQKVMVQGIANGIDYYFADAH